MIIIGFDISSTTTGWGVLQIDGESIKYIDSGFFKPLKKGNIFERLDHSRNKVKEILNKYQPDQVAIENIIEFMAGKSTAKTIITLSVFNRNVGMAVYDYFSSAPELYSVMQIRHALKENKILPKKEEMPELVAKHLGIKFPYYYDKKAKVKKESEDVADAIAVALYHAYKITGKLKKKSKKS
jgi:crossover junction endodeoxyribonuclease RuvC